MSQPKSGSVLTFATEILKKIQSQEIDPQKITIEQRRACVSFLLHERKWTQTEIAEMLKCHKQTITEDKQWLRKNQSIFNVDLLVDETELIYDYIETAKIASARLFRKGLEKFAFEVEDKLIERLQSLGYIRKVANKVEFRGQVSLLEMLNFERELDPTIGSDGDNGHSRNGRDADDNQLGGRLEKTQE